MHITKVLENWRKSSGITTTDFMIKSHLEYLKQQEKRLEGESHGLGFNAMAGDISIEDVAGYNLHITSELELIRKEIKETEALIK